MSGDFLGHVVILEPGVAQQGGFHVLGTIEMMGRQEVSYPAIEVFDPAMGSRARRLGEAVFNARGMAELIKRVSSTGRLFSRARQAVSELLATVGQQPGYLDREGLAQGPAVSAQLSLNLAGKIPVPGRRAFFILPAPGTSGAVCSPGPDKKRF